MRKIDEIIVHCSATREGQDINAKTIRQWHLDRGWKDIGYHYVILLDGTIEKGREDKNEGAHTLGHNHSSIGICYSGGLDKDGKTPKDTRTEKQEESLISLLLSLKKEHKEAIVYGHRDFSNKACPSFDATSEYKWISNGYCKDTQEKI
tara:strand:- start:1654 stop:2100 length:447 start_codon:yes stop_codon:yes gene_type:complete